MSPVRIECRKWPDSPHWEMDALRLGADEHGVWCGITRGTVMTRPGRTISAVADHVTLAPYEEWWLGTFYGPDPRRPFDTYVDIATPSCWEKRGRVDVMRSIDLDLDVVRGTTGRVWVDDEDEFAEHRVSLAYPQDIVEHAMESCTSVLAAMQKREAPFDPWTSTGWLEKFQTKLAGRD